MVYWAVQGGYGVRRKTDPYGIYVAFSPDGLHWTRFSNQEPQILGQSQSSGVQSPYADEVADGMAPLHGGTLWPLPFGTGDVVDAYYDPAQQVFVAQGKTNVIGPEGKTGWKRGVVRSTSHNFVNWTYPELVMAIDETDLANDTGLQLHSAPAFHYSRSGHYFALVQKWNQSNYATIQIELAVSRDGVRWSRPFRDEYFLPCNPTTAFDGDSNGHGDRQCCLWTSATPQIVGGEIRFYYG